MLYLRSHEVAKLLGITRRTLQLWVRGGRIPEPERSQGGYYLWTAADLSDLRALPTLKRGRPPKRANTGDANAA